MNKNNGKQFALTPKEPIDLNAANIQQVEAIDDILPLHEVRDDNKLAKLVDSMQDGWVGLPVLALDSGDHLQALTGSHRIAAAAPQLQSW